jgi:uncharacterized protein involved in outer membrane biogenesis
MKRTRSRIAAVLGFVGIFPALVIGVLLAFEFSIPIDGFRTRVGSALSDALGCPVTIAGSLHVVTGTQPGIEGRDVRLQECRPIRVARASAELVRVRVSLWALFSREIDLTEIAGERLEAELPTDPPAPATTTTPPGQPSRWTFKGIGRLHVAPVRVLVRSADAAPHPVDLLEVDGSARADQPMRLALRGSHGTEEWNASVATATLRDAIAGQDRWPLDFTVAFAGAKGSLRGSWTPAPLGLQADLKLETTAAERLVKAFGGAPPELGSVEMSGRLTAAPGLVGVDEMRFAGPVGAVAGNAQLSMHDGRPRIKVALSAEEVDYAALNRWREVEHGAGSPEEIATRIFARLRKFDGELTAAIKRVKNVPFPADDVNYSAQLEGGKLRVAASATVDGAPGESTLELDARGPFAIDARVAVKSLPRAAVTQASGVARLDSRIGGLHATLSAHSATVVGLFDDMRFDVAGNDIRFVVPNPGNHGDVRLRTLALRGQSRKALHASAAGSFAGEPLAFELTSAPIMDFFERRPWVVERVHARVGAAVVNAQGEVAPLRETRVARFSFDLSVPRLDRLAFLMEGASLPGVSGSMRGSFEYEPEAWNVATTSFAVGATRGSGNAAARRGAPLEIALDVDRLAMDELTAGKGAPRPQRKTEPAPALPDMDLSLNARTATYAGERFDTVAAKVRVRDGAARAPFSLGWVGAEIAGTLSAEFTKAPMRISGNATARGLDVARLPGSLAKQGITGKIDNVAVRAEARGATPAALVANAAISVDVADARMNLPKSDALPDGVHVTFGGNIQAPAAGPIDFSIKGILRDKPFAASGQLPTLDALFPVGKPHAVRLAIDYDRTRLEATGDATIDKDAPHFSGTVNLSGDTLHTLADLVGYSAHGFGPYKISTSLAAEKAGVNANDVAMQLGKSSFRASVAADTRKTRPRFTAKVRGLPVHLEDIGAQALNPEKLEKRAVEEKSSDRPIDEAKIDRDARVLTRMLRAFDFDLDVTFDEISAAGEKVGRAELKAALANGRLTVDPATVWIGQGMFSAEIEVDARGKVPEYTVKFEGSKFDYGPLVRAIDPKSLHQGTLDLSLDIKTSGAPEALEQNATGAVDVLILPKGQQAGALDLLGASAVRIFLQTLDPRSQSQLNCIVGSFDLDKGIATSRIVLLDTTLARVAGELVIDYRTNALKGRFAPHSKRPQLFTVVPGINVSGSFDAPVIGVSPQSVVFSALRIWQFPVAFASDWLVNENMPADGTPDCRAAYRHVLH